MLVEGAGCAAEVRLRRPRDDGRRGGGARCSGVRPARRPARRRRAAVLDAGAAQVTSTVVGVSSPERIAQTLELRGPCRCPTSCGPSSSGSSPTARAGSAETLARRRRSPMTTTPAATPQFASYPSLRGRTAFVSGGASGLGAEFVAPARRPGRAGGVRRRRRGRGRALDADAARRRRRRRCSRRATCGTSRRSRRRSPRAAERLGPIRVLVNNAANDHAAPGRRHGRGAVGRPDRRQSCATTSSPPRPSRR